MSIKSRIKVAKSSIHFSKCKGIYTVQNLKSFETRKPSWGRAKENGIIQSRKTEQRKECLRPGTGGWNHDALERPSHPQTAAGSQLPDDPDPCPLLHAAQCRDFLDLRDGEPEPQQRLILHLAGKRPHPVHPVRTDPAPGPVGPLYSRQTPNLCCWSATIWRTRGSGCCWNRMASPST